DKLTAL
ncbi:hypothetical protein D049_1213B, partial [Vibrio parahaemolyticus VPTS-2010]